MMRLLIIASLALTSTSGWCCSCISPDSFVESQITRDRIVRGTPLIFHARVTAVRPDRSAEIEIVEQFKGRAPKVLRPLAMPESACGTSLTVGEERVFFLSSDSVSACGKFPVTPSLIEIVRQRNNGAI